MLFVFNKRILLLLLSIVLVGIGGYGLQRLNNRLTDGFSVDGIKSDLSYEAIWDMGSATREQQEEIKAILQQPFDYLAKGTQSFVFVSQDGRYILKFFKQKHLRLPWYSALQDQPILGRVIRQKVQRREEKKAKIFAGCCLAYREMADETGVFYLHLNPTDDLPSTLTLRDKRGIVSTIDPNSVAFYMQKRGVPLYSAMEAHRINNDISGAKESLRRTFAYLVDRSHRAILDRDPAYPQNLGFIDGRAGNLDVGNLTKDVLIRNRIEYKRRIKEHMVDLRGWIVVHFPELTSTYDAYLEAL